MTNPVRLICLLYAASILATAVTAWVSISKSDWMVSAAVDRGYESRGVAPSRGGAEARAD